ncbi:MAG: DUF4184 family protein [Candidatus Lokiarchaeota archaeon]|nr:DUF4184 family protein [Candidatus Lokiarchaeota archaeon]
MPSSLFSHQAPGLILKLKYPKKLDGTALCIGTIIPDINVMVNPFLPFEFRNFTHSLLGLLILVIPLTIFLTILFSKCFGPFLAKMAKKFRPMRYLGIDKFENLKKKKFNKKFFIVGIYSALIGGLTHLLLDLPAHENIELFFPLILQSPEILLYSIIDYGTFSIGQIELDGNIRVYDLIWLIETVVFLIITIYLLRYIKKQDLINKWYEEI